jgi:hypothetical protein
MKAHDNIDRSPLVPFRLMHCLLHTREHLRNSNAAKEDAPEKCTVIGVYRLPADAEAMLNVP